MNTVKYSFNIKIYPDKLICDSKMYDILVTDDNYIIQDFDIYTEKNVIKKIVITKGKHPNCSLKDGVFCIPDYLTSLELNQETIEIIKEMFKIYNFESAHYLPWDAFEYEIPDTKPKKRR